MVRTGVYAMILGCVPIDVLHADEEGEPDMAFLEYLGMWDEQDEQEWQLLEEEQVVAGKETSDTAPKSEESVEKDDEN